MCIFKMPKVSMPQVTATARDTISQRESAEPNAPVFGSSSSSYSDIASKKRGIGALKIDPQSSATRTVM